MSGHLSMRRFAAPGSGGVPGKHVNPRIAVTFEAADMAEIHRRAKAAGQSTACQIRQLVNIALAKSEAL